MFWENYEALCRQIGKAPGTVAAEIGLSNAATTSWKKGAMPKNSTLKKVADYFGVPVSALLAQKSDPGNARDATKNDMDDILQTLRERPDMRILFKTSQKATPEAVLKVAELLKAFNNEDTD